MCGGLAVLGGIYKTKVWFLGSQFSDGHFSLRLIIELKRVQKSLFQSQ